jgi:hypothetical protein
LSSSVGVDYRFDGGFNDRPKRCGVQTSRLNFPSV